MAEALYLATKRTGVGQHTVNAVFACLVNSDSAGTDAEKLADADAAAIRLGHAIESPYFDTIALVSTASGVVGDDLDSVVFSGGDQPAATESAAP
jgi:hypothetical protein